MNSHFMKIAFLPEWLGVGNAAPFLAIASVNVLRDFCSVHARLP